MGNCCILIFLLCKVTDRVETLDFLMTAIRFLYHKIEKRNSLPIKRLDSIFADVVQRAPVSLKYMGNTGV